MTKYYFKTLRSERYSLVASLADVLASIVALSVRYVQHHEAEVRHGLDPGGVAQRLAVVEPLYLHVRVAHRDQRALEMSRVSILQTFYALRPPGKVLVWISTIVRIKIKVTVLYKTEYFIILLNSSKSTFKIMEFFILV